MKLHQRFSTLALVVMLGACSGSGTYRGEWKATATDGSHATLVFEEKKLHVTGGDGKMELLDYRQHSVEIANSVSKYGIRLGDGREYVLVFPTKDKTRAVMVDGAGMPVYTLGRNGYLSYDAVSRP